MKRNENLIPLSHDHHHGLLFCSRLKKVDNTSPEVVLEYINDYYKNLLEKHLEEEENAFLHFIHDEKLKTKFLNDHQMIHQMVNNINAFTEDIFDQAKILGLFLNSHIRFEERILFPWLEKHLEESELFSIGNELDVDVTEADAHAFEPIF